jgi:hypothetical protein
MACQSLHHACLLDDGLLDFTLLFASPGKQVRLILHVPVGRWLYNQQLLDLKQIHLWNIASCVLLQILAAATSTWLFLPEHHSRVAGGRACV